MDITMLKSGLWGYKKNSVCEYIAEINQEFSYKLMDTIKNYDQKEKELHERISRLEEENAILREDRDRVTMIMTDAKKFSDDLRREAEMENKKFRDSNERYNTEQRRLIEEFCANIDQIRDSVYHLLNSFDMELSEVKNDLTSIDSSLQELDSCVGAEKNYEE